MFFRNLTMYRFDADVAADLVRLDGALHDHGLRDVGPMEMFTRGFVPPIGHVDDDSPLTQSIDHATLFTYGEQDRMLPAHVVNDALAAKVRKISAEEHRQIGGRERRRIKEDVLTELLPRAFVRNGRTSGYVDKRAGWLVIDTSSRSAAETVVTGLREALGSFPAIPLAPEESPRVLMTDWLANDGLPAGFALGDECELRDPATSTGAIAMCRRQDMDAEEVKEHLRNGKQVFKLGLVFDDRLSFVLGEDLVIRKLKFLDVVMDELGDAEDKAQEHLASFTLMRLELDRLLTKLSEIFGLNVDAPLRMHRQDAPDGMQKVVGKFVDSMKKAVGPGGSVTISGGGHSTTIHADDDGLLVKAIATVRRTGRVSISGVQRELQIGYNRAARLIDEMEQRGIVSTLNPSGARHVIT